jgi:hypothetical protein
LSSGAQGWADIGGNGDGMGRLEPLEVDEMVDW